MEFKRVINKSSPTTSIILLVSLFFSFSSPIGAGPGLDRSALRVPQDAESGASVRTRLQQSGLEESSQSAPKVSSVKNIDQALDIAKRIYKIQDGELFQIRRFLEGKLSTTEAVAEMVNGSLANLPNWKERRQNAPPEPAPPPDSVRQDALRRNNAIAFLGALWVTARYGLTLQGMQWMQSFLVGTMTPQELVRHMESGQPGRPFAWITFERMLADGLRVGLWAGESGAYLETRQRLFPLLREFRKERVQIITPETENQIWLLWLDDAAVYDSAWKFSDPVKVQNGDSVEELPLWTSNVLPFPAADTDVADSIIGSADLSWEGYLSVDNIPLPPELLGEEGSPFFGSLLSSQAVFLGDKSVLMERRKEFASLLDRHVRVWGHYWLPSSGNGDGVVEMKVKMRPVDIQRTATGLRIRFQAQIPNNQAVASPFVGEVWNDGQRHALSLREQKGWVRIIPARFSGQSTEREPKQGPTRLKELVAAGRLVSVVLGGSVRSIPLARTELLSNLVHESVERANSSGESVFLFGNLGPEEDKTTARVDPGPLAGFMPADYVNAAIQWVGVDPDGVWLGVRSGSLGAFVFEGNQSNLEKVLARAEETVGILGQESNPFTHYAVKVEAQPNGLFRLFLAPRDPKTMGAGWTVLADQNFYAVELFPGQAGLATEQQLRDYGFTKMPRHPSQHGQKIEGPLIRTGEPLLAGPVGALALHGGVLTEASSDAYHDTFFTHRVRLAMSRAGIPSTDSRIGDQLARWQQFRKPEELAEQRVADLVNKLLQPFADLETLIEVMETFRDGGPRLRYEQGFRRLPPDRQVAFNRKVWNMLQRMSQEQPARVLLEPIFHPDESGISFDDKEKQGIVATSFSPTWDLIVAMERGSSTEDPVVLRVRYKVGGPVAQTLQAVRLLEPAFPARFFGPVGNSIGQAVRDSLESQGIEVQGGNADSEPRPAVIVARAAGDEVRLVPSDSGISDNWAEKIRSSREAAVESGQAWIIGDRLSDSSTLQMEVARKLSSEIREAVQAKVQVYLSVHQSWHAGMIQEILKASPQNVFLPAEELARLFPAEDSATLREDPWKLAGLADRIRIRYNISGGILVSLGTSGFILVDREQWYAVPPAEFWVSYTTGATDSSLGVFLSARLKGDAPLEALKKMAAAYGVYRGRPSESRGLPPTWNEIDHGPIPRLQPIPSRLANIMEEIGEFPSDGKAASVQAWWAKVIVGLVSLLEQSDVRPSEKIAILLALFQVERDHSNYPLHTIPLRDLLLYAMNNPNPEIQEFARQQWSKREEEDWLPLLEVIRQMDTGTIYRVEYDRSLVQGYDDPEKLPGHHELAQAMESRGGRVEFGWFNPSRKPEPGVRRVVLLTPENARLHKPDADSADFRVLPVEATGRPDETKLWSRALVLGLVMASLPENPPADHPGITALQRYFRFLGVGLSREELQKYFSRQIVDQEWDTLVGRITLNLTAWPLLPLRELSFDDFLSEWTADLSA